MRLAMPGEWGVRAVGDTASGSVLRTEVRSMGLSPSVVASCAGLVRQLQVNNYRRKSASVTDVSVRPVWCRLAWTLPRYRARLPRTGYRPSTAAGASLQVSRSQKALQSRWTSGARGGA